MVKVILQEYVMRVCDTSFYPSCTLLARIIKLYASSIFHFPFLANFLEDIIFSQFVIKLQILRTKRRDVNSSREDKIDWNCQTLFQYNIIYNCTKVSFIADYFYIKIYYREQEDLRYFKDTTNTFLETIVQFETKRSSNRFDDKPRPINSHVRSFWIT